MLTILVEPERSNFLIRIAHTYRPGGSWRLPRPSELFPALNTRLDDRFIRDGRDTDITFIQLVAAVPSGDQRDFYERYLTDPARALKWSRLPRWKRPIMAGDDQDKLIWGLFTMTRLRIYGHINGHPATVPGLGRSLVQEIGFWEGIKDHRRACLVLSMYGSMLAHGEDVGDVVTPPWKEKPPTASGAEQSSAR